MRRFPTGLVVVGLVVLGLLALRRAADRLERRAEEEGIGWVDPALLGGLEFPDWTDPRWKLEYEELLDSFGPLHLEDEAALDELWDALSELSFVAEVHVLEGIWPDELELDFALRRPVACIPVPIGSSGGVESFRELGTMYRAVATDGTLLTGLWERPPRFLEGWLPVIGPLDDEVALELFSYSEAGDWLAEPEHLDALDVACSLVRELEPAEREQLGRVVIDAEWARHASLLEPGVRLDLEDRRRVLFGRAPSAPFPGELEAALKWRSLARGLARTDDPATDWDVLDVRWDVPDVLLRQGFATDEETWQVAEAKPSEPRSSLLR